MERLREMLAELKAAVAELKSRPEPPRFVWATVTATAAGGNYMVRFDTQTSSHPAIALKSYTIEDRVLCVRQGLQTIIIDVKT